MTGNKTLAFPKCVTYMAPVITASSRRNTGFGWPQHMVPAAKTGALNLEETEVPGWILDGLGRIFGICLWPTPRESCERLERGARGSESGGRDCNIYGPGNHGQQLMRYRFWLAAVKCPVSPIFTTKVSRFFFAFDRQPASSLKML